MHRKDLWKKKKEEEEEWNLWAYRKNKQEINPWIWYLWHVPSCARRITNSFAFPLSLFLFILLKEYSEEVGKKLDWPSFALLYFNGEWNWPLNRIWWGLSDDEISKRQIEKNVCRNVSGCSVFVFFCYFIRFHLKTENTVNFDIFAECVSVGLDKNFKYSLKNSILVAFFTAIAVLWVKNSFRMDDDFHLSFTLLIFQVAEFFCFSHSIWLSSECQFN